MTLTIQNPTRAQESGKNFSAYWDNGLSMRSEDGTVSLSIGGRIQNDWAFIRMDDELENDLQDPVKYNTGFRRVRLFQKGAVGNNFKYKLQMDFAGGSAVVKDAYLHLTDIPIVGNIRAGHQKEFFSLEQMSSSNDVVFIERSLGDIFIPTRNSGLTFFDHYMDGRIAWGAGVYRQTDGFGFPNQTQQGNFNLTSRVSGVPWYQDSAHLLMLGGSISRRDPDNNEVQYDSDPESNLAGDYINSGLISNVSVNFVTNYSLAAVLGPLSVQGEYMASEARATNDGLFSGYYGQVSYFLTDGDHRNCSPKEMSFSGVQPQNNFNLQKNKGTGAFEIALRYSTLDLDDQFNTGGEMTDITGGINWYLNPNSRIMFNYVLANVKGSGRSNVFQTRFQVTF